MEILTDHRLETEELVRDCVLEASCSAFELPFSGECFWIYYVSTPTVFCPSCKICIPTKVGGGGGVIAPRFNKAAVMVGIAIVK